MLCFEDTGLAALLNRDLNLFERIAGAEAGIWDGPFPIPSKKCLSKDNLFDFEGSCYQLWIQQRQQQQDPIHVSNEWSSLY